ncbi:MAG: flippase [Ignavibacteriales bacterium]|nr:MAG: flippase [Ignavibacteriales bacterium]
MADKNYWLRSGTYTLLQRLFTVLFGFGSFAILVRYLSKDDFGIYALFISVSSLIEVARIGLIQNALIKFLSSAKDEDYKEIISSSFFLNILVTVILVAVLVIAAPFLGTLWNSEKIVPLFYLYTITTVILIFFHQFNYLQQANLDFRGFFFSNFARHGSFFLMVIAEVYFIKPDADLNRLVIYLSVGAVLGTLTSFGFGKKYLRMAGYISREWVKRLFQYGKYVFGTNISTMLFTSIDQFMLGTMLPTSSVAVFNTANRVNNLIDVPVSSVAAIVFPQSAKRASEEGHDTAARLYEKSVGVLVAILLPALFFMFLLADWVIIIIAGSAYLESAPILRVILITAFFQPFVRQFGTIMDSVGRPKTNFYLIMIISLLNVASNYIFIKAFGTIGAALGTLVTMALFTVIAQILLKKYLQVRLISVFAQIPETYMEVFRIGAQAMAKIKKR